MAPPLILIIESDMQAVAQMRRVLAGMGARVYAVSDEASLAETASALDRAAMPPSLVVARVALPTGSGIRMLDETLARFPGAGGLLISHHPHSLLMSVPGFAKHASTFLKAEFNDEQFRAAVERAMPHGGAAAR